MRCWLGGHQYEMRDWQPVAVYEGESDRRPLRRYTLLLQMCTRCGKPRTRKVEGGWTNNPAAPSTHVSDAPEDGR